jgi:ABC-type nitrate/sulfonate/bicarbonate transport system permease component
VRKEILYGPILLIFFWYLLYLTGFIHPLFLPPPHAVIAKLLEVLTTLEVWKDIAFSFWRIMVGFLIAAVIGIPIGLLMGLYKKVYSSFEVLVDFFRSLPALAVFPLLMSFFGIGDSAKIATVVFSCTLIIIVNSIYGVVNSKRTRQIVAYLMDAQPNEIFWKVTLMDALPQVFVGLRTSLSLAVVVVIVTEMFIGTTWGVGRRIFESQQTYRITEMYAAIIIAGFIGYILNKAFIETEKRIVHWSGR